MDILLSHEETGEELWRSVKWWNGHW